MHRIDLRSLFAWVTAVRRGQTSERAGIRKVDWDRKFGLVKISFLADWTREMVWRYIVKHGVPYKQLHDRNYPSIGCMQCTRAVLPGEDQRAGRWSGFGKRECGLHTPPEANGAVALVQLVPAGVEE